MRRQYILPACNFQAKNLASTNLSTTILQITDLGRIFAQRGPAHQDLIVNLEKFLQCRDPPDEAYRAARLLSTATGKSALTSFAIIPLRHYSTSDSSSYIAQSDTILLLIIFFGWLRSKIKEWVVGLRISIPHTSRNGQGSPCALTRSCQPRKRGVTQQAQQPA